MRQVNTTDEAGDLMNELLTVKQVAQLRGCSVKFLQRLIRDGKVSVRQTTSPANGHKQYMIPLSELPADLQLRYIEQNKPKDLPELPVPEPKRKPAKEPKEPERRSLDEFSSEEREQIAQWIGVVEEWLKYRSGYDRQTDADAPFVQLMRSKQTDLVISVSILYRRLNAYRAGDLNGLVDKRGGWNRGSSTIPEDMWNYFVWCYLDDRCVAITQCYEMTQQWARDFMPGVPVPHEQAFRRKAATLEKAVVTMGRGGMKKYDDRCAPYITRLYDDLYANDYWVADNHTLDIISKADDGSEVQHRLSLTAFIDARAGVVVGWNLTDNPCSQSTLIALRHAILRFGIPRRIYVDNGLEFLCHDIGGKGHRARQSQSLITDPPPVFKRLGIDMVNAIVRNAKAKPIERTFGTLKGIISRMFPTFTGGNVLEKPESLRATLKKGNLPLDSQLHYLVGEMIDGIYNVGLYGGSVQRDKGKTRIEVWNESIEAVGMRKASEADLALMLMRSSRVQTIGKKGVYITVCGERLEYHDDTIWRMQGTEVYVRYDPANLLSVRVYEAETDRYLCTVPMALSTLLHFDAAAEEVAVAQEDVRHVKKAVKGQLAEYRSKLPAERQITLLDMRIRQMHSGKEGFEIKHPTVIIPVRANEEHELQAAVGGQATGVIIDMQRMNRNAEARRGRSD